MRSCATPRPDTPAVGSRSARSCLWGKRASAALVSTNGSAAHRQKRQGDPRLKLGERATQDLEGPWRPRLAAWLSLERYAETFRDNAIDVAVLPELSEADLEKLGDASSADRTLQAVLVESYLVETCGV